MFSEDRSSKHLIEHLLPLAKDNNELSIDNEMIDLISACSVESQKGTCLSHIIGLGNSPQSTTVGYVIVILHNAINADITGNPFKSF